MIRKGAGAVVGISIGIAVGLWIQPTAIGFLLGVGIGLRIMGITNLKAGAIYGAILGTGIGAVLNPLIVSGLSPSAMVMGAVLGAGFGTISGAVLGRLFRAQDKGGEILW